MRAYDHVTKFSGGATLAAINLAVENNSGTDAFSHQHQNEIARITNLWSSEPKLGQRHGVRIIVNGHRQASRRLPQ